MASPRIGRSGLRSPRGWLFLAFLGVWLYLASQLLRLYPARVAEIVVLPVSEVREVLALTSGLGQLLFFGGLVAALWRANLAAGASSAGIRGLAVGVAGGGPPRGGGIPPLPQLVGGAGHPRGLVWGDPRPRPRGQRRAPPPVFRLCPPRAAL